MKGKTTYAEGMHLPLEQSKRKVLGFYMRNTPPLPPHQPQNLGN